MQHHYDVSLAPYTTFHFDESARHVIDVATVDDVVHACKEYGSSLLVLGGGSNILVTSAIERPVLRTVIRGRAITMDDGNAVDVTFGAGESWHDAVEWLVTNGLGGLENLALIPGTVGAAPIQNIGAYGTEQERCFRYLEYIDMATGRKVVMHHADCAFGYRDSVFKNDLRGTIVITSVTYRLHRHAPLDTSYADVQHWLQEREISDPGRKDVFDAIIDIRRNKLPDPEDVGNAGSFFKNPVVTGEEFQRIQSRASGVPSWHMADGRVKMPAAWFIDQCGWKGYADGAIGVHHKQALVLVHTGGGKGRQILELARRIASSVFDRYGVHLEPEVQIWPPN